MADKDLTNRQLLEEIDKRFATKDELKAFATKDDLQAFATKDDLQAFATKDDLKAFATKDDLRTIKDDLEGAIARLERKIDGNQRANIRHHLETKEAVGQVNKDLTRLREGLAKAAGLA